jgi:hypothetical protein
MKVQFPGVASLEVGKFSKSKRRRRKDEGTFPGDGWPCVVLSQKEEEERMKVRSPGAAPESMIKRRRRIRRGTGEGGHMHNER